MILTSDRGDRTHVRDGSTRSSVESDVMQRQAGSILDFGPLFSKLLIVCMCLTHIVITHTMQFAPFGMALLIFDGDLYQVASYIRAVLRTIAQCHSHRILHRDVKPGNFMLLNDSPSAPLKAIGETWASVSSP